MKERHMKKGWKIALISLLSVIGLLIVVVALALYLVFTPKQLTRIVNTVVPRFVQADTHFGQVDLTLLSTFPDVGLVIDSVYIVNPTEGAPSDTLARIGQLTVGLDAKAFLKENKVIVHQVQLNDAQANLYIAPDGRTNFDIFPTSDDKEEDTSATSLPALVDLNKIAINNLSATLLDQRDGMQAQVDGLELKLKGRLDSASVDANLKVNGKNVAFCMTDSLGATTLDAALQELCLTLSGKGNLDEANGQLTVGVEKGTLNAGGTAMVNEALGQSNKQLLNINLPITLSLNKGKASLTDPAHIALDHYKLWIDSGSVQMATDSIPMFLDFDLHTDGDWQVGPLLALVPDAFMDWKKGMDVDGKVGLHGQVTGCLNDSLMPVVHASVDLADGQFYYPSALPYKLNKIEGGLTAHIDLNPNKQSSAIIKNLKAHTRQTDVYIDGNIDNLLGDMLVSATLRGNTQLADLMPMLDGVPLQGNANADLKVHATFLMSQIQRQAFDKIDALGDIALKNVDVTYDTLHAVAPSLDLSFRLPAKKHKGRMADAEVQLPQTLLVEMPNMGMKAQVDKASINLGVNDVMKQQVAADVELALGETTIQIDSTEVSAVSVAFDGTVALDSTQTNPIRQYNPRANIDLNNVVLYMPTLPDAVRLTEFDFHYANDVMRIGKAEVKVGHTDFALDGEVSHIEGWLDHKQMLTGDLNFTSNYADVDQLMDMFSGMGSDVDTLQQMRAEDDVPAEANPFIVPKDVDITLHTHIKRSIAFGNDLNDVAGGLTIHDGSAVLDQMGFVCKAASMQLTALYQSPRPNNLFVSLDFHLLDIQIDELIDMIPTIDTLVPMLAAFDGNANFHLAAETFLDANYQPKMSSLLGSAAISGKNLVVMDDASIATIAKLMRFKSWKDHDNKIRIDSLDVELTCFRKEIEVYPFLLNIGKYQLCASGKHNLDNQCNYHVELLKNPIMAKVGVDVKGSLDSPKISLGSVRYADLYKPDRQGVVEKRVLAQKEMIRKALEANVR